MTLNRLQETLNKCHSKWRCKPLDFAIYCLDKLLSSFIDQLILAYLAINERY